MKLLRKEQIQTMAYEPRDWELSAQCSSDCHNETAARLPLAPRFPHAGAIVPPVYILMLQTDEAALSASTLLLFEHVLLHTAEFTPPGS